MDLRQLRALDAVFRTGTFAAAARERHVTQPALWAQVKSLEDEWRVALFEKSGRLVRPTRAALALRPLVEHLLRSASELEVEAESVRTGRAASARIGCAHHHVAQFLAEAIARHAARHPSTPTPRIVPMTYARSDAALVSGEVDLLVSIRSPGTAFEGFVIHRAWPAVAHASLRRRRTMEFAALRDLPIATVPRERMIREVFEQACARAGVTPRVVFEEAGAAPLLALARHGVAYAVLSSEALAEAPDVPAAQLVERGRVMEREVALQWRSEASLSASARQLRDVLRELVSERSKRRRRHRA